VREAQRPRHHGGKTQARQLLTALTHEIDSQNQVRELITSG
jgi:hypothetical protein